MSATTAPAVKAALLTLMQADALFVTDAVQVRYAHPGSTIGQDAIYMGKVVEHEAAAALGALRRDEDYDLDVIVDCYRDGPNDTAAQAAEQTCLAYVQELENLIRANPGRGSDAFASIVNGWVVFQSYTVTPYPESAGRLSEAVCVVHVKHRK